MNLRLRRSGRGPQACGSGPVWRGVRTCPGCHGVCRVYLRRVPHERLAQRHPHPTVVSPSAASCREEVLSGYEPDTIFGPAPVIFAIAARCPTRAKALCRRTSPAALRLSARSADTGRRSSAAAAARCRKISRHRAPASCARVCAGAATSAPPNPQGRRRDLPSAGTRGALPCCIAGTMRPVPPKLRCRTVRSTCTGRIAPGLNVPGGRPTNRRGVCRLNGRLDAPGSFATILAQPCEFAGVSSPAICPGQNASGRRQGPVPRPTCMDRAVMAVAV